MEVQTIDVPELGRLRRLVPATVADSRLRLFATAVLTHRRLWLVAAVVGGCLTLSSLQAGLLLDDYHFKLLVQGSDSPARILKSPLDMWRMLDGDMQHTRALMDHGFLPWWTDEAIKYAFWRPVSSLTHWADYLLWPDSPAFMHVQSVLWYALLAGAVSLLYQRLMGLTVAAGIAALLYCMDDAHAVPVGFLANRNAVLAALFGVLCLVAHLRWRQQAWKPGAFLAPAALVLSLLSKEEGIAAIAYLVAFALLLDKAPWRQRLLSLAPYAVVVVVWRFFWSHLGYGVLHFGPYVDPVAEPFRFACSLMTNAPILLLAQLATPPADLCVVLEAGVLRWFCAGAWVFVILVGAIWLPLLRRDRVARFWLVGMLLALVPMCTTFPSDRMLLFVGLGAMGLMAQFLTRLFTDPAAWPRQRVWRTTVVILASVFVLRHAVAAPLNLPLRAATPMGPQFVMDRLFLKHPLDAGIVKQDLVVVNAPLVFVMMTSPLVWASENAPMPKHMRILASSHFQPVGVYRLDERTIRVNLGPDFLAWTDDGLWRGVDRPMTIGQQVRLTGMTVEVTALTRDGRPAEATFRFDVPLEDTSLRWLQWKGGAFMPFVPPPVGQSVTVEGSWKDAIFGRGY